MEDLKSLCDAIASKKLTNLSIANDYFEALLLCRDSKEDGMYDYSMEKGRKLYDIINKQLAKTLNEASKSKARADVILQTDSAEWYELKRKCTLMLAPESFDLYMQYLEWNRAPETKFWLPRRKILLPLVKDLEDLERKKIKFLGISLPPRTGKSTLCIFYLTWHIGRHPNSSNAMGGHAKPLVDGFFKELLTVFDSNGEYLWQDVFPSAKFESKSIEYLTINFNKPKRFPTMTCRSAEGTWTGAVDISNDGILYVDDLVRDYEEASSPMRMQAKYDVYVGQMKDRKKDQATELMVGTRWNILDPLGRTKELYGDNPDYKFAVIPAMNENDESNFVYDYNVGFSTAYYRDMRASVGDNMWWAKYMGQPYVREGLLFPADSLNYHNGVFPDTRPDRIIAVCDVSWGGGDYLSMPIFYIYGDDWYCVDVVYNNGNKNVTRPIVLGKLQKWQPDQVQFEANNGGREYAEYIDSKLREKNIHINITSKKAPNNIDKMSRIIKYSPDIIKIKFLERKYCSSEYQKFLDDLCFFTASGKNLHDDAPDSLAMAVDMLFSNAGILTVNKRPF